MTLYFNAYRNQSLIPYKVCAGFYACINGFIEQFSDNY